jgi:CMP-N-acetylneuraminic acid synthetase
MKVLGIIPARGKSKRVPRKNIRPFAGKPLIAYTIENSLQSTRISRLIVSTDSTEIAETARRYGADVPFVRPSSLAEDTTPDQPVFRHALEWLKEHEDYEPDIVLNLRPTTPFKTPQIIEKVIQRIVDTGADIVRTVTRIEGVHHPYWMYELSEEGYASPFVDHIDVAQYYQRQLLPDVYRINGVVDAMRTQVIHNGDILSTRNMVGVVIAPEDSIDIDNEFDFKVCELLMHSRMDPLRQ